MKTLLSQVKSLGRYKLGHELGQGGMSVVYLANDTELGREVAIKCVDSDDQSTAHLAVRLRSEAKLLAQLNHANIVQLYDVVEQDHILGLVIEYIGGDTLTQRLKQNPNKEVKLKWLAEVSAGLASAHSKGIAHCDLKTDNVLITHDNVAKIADFGIAKLKLDDYLDNTAKSRSKKVTGSYFSLSPEQATGRAVDTRTDLFSLGVLIHITLTGEHPFGDTNNKSQLLQNIIHSTVEITPTNRQLLGPRISELVTNLLSKDPVDRAYHPMDVVELLKGERHHVPTSDTLTHTVVIDTQKPHQRFKSNYKSVIGKAALIGAGFLVGVILLRLLPNGDSPATAASEVTYIALDNIEVKTSNDFNATSLSLVTNTLQQSAERTILGFKETGLVEARELNLSDGTYIEKAKAAGVKDILAISADCTRHKCDIKLQRRSGERMAVTQQTIFPVANDSLIELRNAISNQIPKLFNEKILAFSAREMQLDEESYRQYLSIYSATKSGTSATPVDFKLITELLSNRANFAPAYGLAYLIANHIDRNVGTKENLKVLQLFFNGAPKRLEQNRVFRRAQVQLALSLNNIEQAKSIFSVLQQDVDDALYLSEIESAIAYADNDYEKLLLLDQQNAIWRPTVGNLYNLASSEFFFGNFEAAQAQVDSILSINSNDYYALELKASIQMSLGKVNDAINTYKSFVSQSQDSTAYSNYGLALSLNKNYTTALKNHLTAIDINPNAPLFHLNLADTYKLKGSPELAKKSYEHVLSIIGEPRTPQDFSTLSQAYAQLGMHSEAVKALKVANKRFPKLAELDYASATVNTLAGNYVTAVVDVADAIERGTAPVWFSFAWFTPLCKYPEFIAKTGTVASQICDQVSPSTY